VWRNKQHIVFFPDTFVATDNLSINGNFLPSASALSINNINNSVLFLLLLLLLLLNTYTFKQSRIEQSYNGMKTRHSSSDIRSMTTANGSQISG
jgi:hypothetical protein